MSGINQFSLLLLFICSYFAIFSLDENKEEEDIPARKKLNVKNNEKEDKVCIYDRTIELALK